MPAENTCSIAEARALIAHQLSVLQSRPELAGAISPIMLWGPPGVGKSSVVRDLCAERGVGFIDIRLAQREPIDLRGLPVPRGDAVEWLLSSEWPRDAASSGVLLFDELTSADRTLQVAAYELILDRRLGTLYSLPPGWLVMAAGNRTQDRAAAGSLSSALANRFCHLDLKPQCSEWLAWARKRGLHPLVTGFLQFRPGLFFDMQSGDLQRGWPSPRSWERVAVALEHAGALPQSLLDRQIEGLVGMAAGAEFAQFRALAQSLPDILGLLTGQVDLTLPVRADVRHALCAAITHHFPQVADHPRAVGRLLEVVLRLPADFATLLLSDVLRGSSPEAADRIFRHAEFAAVQRKLGPSLDGRLQGHLSREVAALLEECA